MVKFFSPTEEEQIIKSIKEAETNTSGEIRVHLHEDMDGKQDVMDVAQKVFNRLKMYKTEARNGVLIFIVPAAHKFAILGDKGINEIVPENYWEDVRDIMQQYFREGQFANGTCAAIERIGQKLKDFFPYQQDDQNELPDDISYT